MILYGSRERGKRSLAALAQAHFRRGILNEWLRSLRVGERSVAELVGGSPVLFRDGPKALHVREIAERVGVAVEEVLFFDDRLSDVASVGREGATAVHCPGGLRGPHRAQQSAWPAWGSLAGRVLELEAKPCMKP